MAPNLEQFIAHARRFGPEEVFETAETCGLDPIELGHLQRDLAEITAKRVVHVHRRRARRAR
jgi:hypothetical protein